MNISKIRRAVEEAEKFIFAAKKVEEQYQGRGNGVFITGTKATGTLRRRSLDLTNALTEMRK
jgi:hypothetical protein